VLNGRVLISLIQVEKKVHLQDFLKMLNFLDLHVPRLVSLLIMIKNNQVEDSQKIYYEAPIIEPIDEASSSFGSPTYSAMQPPIFSSVNVISKPFKISRGIKV